MLVSVCWFLVDMSVCDGVVLRCSMKLFLDVVLSYLNRWLRLLSLRWWFVLMMLICVFVLLNCVLLSLLSLCMWWMNVGLCFWLSVVVSEYGLIVIDMVGIVLL